MASLPLSSLPPSFGPGIPTVTFNGVTYPEFQTNGNAARFCRPFAMEVCKGEGLDIGYGKPEWKLPHAIGVDPVINPEYHAMKLPDNPGGWDFIHSSHCLEHLHDPYGVLNYWATQLKKGAVLFLYLPHFSQEYWRPWHNRKHINILEPQHLRDYFKAQGWTRCFVSEVDLYNSFMVITQK